MGIWTQVELVGFHVQGFFHADIGDFSWRSEREREAGMDKVI
jgi:hypothetical protein